MAHCYVLENKDKRHYIGITNLEPEKRLEKHNKGDIYSTKSGSPWKIIYSRCFKTIEEARSLEKKIKSWKGGNTFKKFLSGAAGSSNGRMRLSESRHLGSNPSPAALDGNIKNLAG